MESPIAAWHDDHVRFARLLDLLEFHIDAFHRGEHPNYELMGDIVYYLRSYADCVHHPREDAAFRRIAQRDGKLELVVARLLQEHRVISVIGDDLVRHLEAASGDSIVPRAELEAAAAAYLVYYRNHLNREEQEILPRAAQILTPGDWSEVSAAVAGADDPLFGECAELRFQELRRQIDREAAVPVES